MPEGKLDSPRIAHAEGGPEIWAYVDGPARTFPGDSGDVADLTGRYPAGTRVGGVAWDRGPYGWHARLDGSTGSIQFAPIQAVTDQVTIIIRGVNTALVQFAGIAMKRGAATSGLLTGISGDRFGYIWRDDYWPWSGGPFIPTGWFSVALVIRPDRATISCLTIDGAFTSATNTATHAADNFGDGPLKLGWDDADANRRWAGGLDNFRFFPRALDDAEVFSELSDPDRRLRRRRRTAVFAPAGGGTAVSGAAFRPAGGVLGCGIF